jgi:glycosyltransferase involved in cell wall biosynthesis
LTKDNYLATIIIPFHGNNKTLELLLDTIPDRFDLEILIVNDIFDAKPFKYSKFFKSNLIELKNDKLKRWAGASRNTGLRYSRGNFIFFADSDDLLLTENFNNLLNTLNGLDDFSFAVCPVTSMMQGTGEASNRHLRYESIVKEFLSSKLKTDLLRHYVPWGKVYSRSFLLDNSIFFEEVVASNDVLFSAKCLINSKEVLVIDSLFYIVTESRTSLTRVMTKDIAKARFLELCKYNLYLKNNGYQKNLAAMSGQLFNILKMYPLFFLYAFAVSIYKGFPIFYNIKHLKKIINREFRGKV